MNLAIEVGQFESNNLHFADPIRNNVISDSKFVRFVYLADAFGTNGVHLLFGLNEQHDLREQEEAFIHIEQDILAKYAFSPASQQKLPQHKLAEYLRSPNFKWLEDFPAHCNHSAVLKLSGLWETQTHFGLTFKFVAVTELLPLLHLQDSEG